MGRPGSRGRGRHRRNYFVGSQPRNPGRDFNDRSRRRVASSLIEPMDAEIAPRRRDAETGKKSPRRRARARGLTLARFYGDSFRRNRAVPGIELN